jgi:hypothetical protein
LSQKQAGRLFQQIQNRLRSAPFFQSRIANATTSEIRFYTDRDLKKKKEEESNGGKLAIPGSVVIICGHSNPDSLAGYNAILILFDELAFYEDGGKISGRYFYDRLKPAILQFQNYGEGRLVEISSPNARSGVFYEIYKSAKADDSILSFQLPTWSIRPDFPYEMDEFEKDRRANIESFAIEVGAQFANHGSHGPYFQPGQIDRCLTQPISAHTRPNPKFNYFLHIDPAKSGDNYSAVLVAKERYVNQRGQKRTRCYLANAWIWKPEPHYGLNIHKIDQEIIKICSVFRPSTVTYDAFNSHHSIQLLRSHGIHTNEVSFNRASKAKMYQNLRNMMSYEPDPEIYLHEDGEAAILLVQELRAIKYSETQRGYKIIKDRLGDVKTDDLADSLAGAVASASEGLRMALPEPTVVRMGYV